MKQLFLITQIFLSFIVFGQNKFYATVFDEDLNPIARGFFKSAADSGIIILVEDMEIFISSTEITTLKIEKNPSKAQFLKLGAAAANDVANYLVSRPSGKDNVDSTSSEDEEAQQSYTTQSKDELFERIHALVQNLLSGANDLATISINNSAEKFLGKLRLLQQYSIEKEIVAWAGVVEGEEAIPEHEDGFQQDAATEVDDSNNESSTVLIDTAKLVHVQAKPKVVTLNKGFHIIRPPSKSAATGISGTKEAGAGVRNVSTTRNVIVNRNEMPAKRQTTGITHQNTKEHNVKTSSGTIKNVPVKPSSQKTNIKKAMPVKQLPSKVNKKTNIG